MTSWENWAWDAPGGWQQPSSVPDPLADVEYVGNVEKDSEAEVSALLKAFKERAAKEQERFDLVTDSEYWFCVCFESREQKEKFLSAVGWMEIGDKYLDGIKVARKMNITLERIQFPKPQKWQAR